MEKVKFTFYVSEELADKLEEVIALYRLKRKEKLTKSQVMEEALREKLEKLEKELGEG